MNTLVKYDPISDAAYIRLSLEAVTESAEVADGIVLDYDAAGRIVGLEVLHVQTQLSPSSTGGA